MGFTNEEVAKLLLKMLPEALFDPWFRVYMKWFYCFAPCNLAIDDGNSTWYRTLLAIKRAPPGWCGLLWWQWRAYGDSTWCCETSYFQCTLLHLSPESRGNLFHPWNCSWLHTLLFQRVNHFESVQITLGSLRLWWVKQECPWIGDSPSSTRWGVWSVHRFVSIRRCKAEVHTTGTDTKQPLQSYAALTLSASMTFRDYATLGWHVGCNEVFEQDFRKPRNSEYFLRFFQFTRSCQAPSLFRALAFPGKEHGVCVVWAKVRNSVPRHCSRIVQ